MTQEFILRTYMARQMAVIQIIFGDMASIRSAALMTPDCSTKDRALSENYHIVGNVVVQYYIAPPHFVVSGEIINAMASDKASGADD